MSKNVSYHSAVWDTRVSNYDPTAADVAPEVADNVLIAWPAIVEQIRKNISSTGLPILDFGCGTGGLTRILSQLGPHVDGLDSSTNMIATARRADIPENVNFILGDIFELPDKKYQCIVSCMVLQFIHNLSVTAQRFSELLNEGGLLSFTSFTPEFVQNNIGSWFKQDGPNYFHSNAETDVPVFIRDTELFEKIFAKFGFQMVYSGELPFNEIFLNKYWTPDSNLDVSAPEFLLMTFVKC
jgi:SAM-dependent methyltransferase